MTVSIHFVEWLIALVGIGAAMVPPTVFAVDEIIDSSARAARMRDQISDWRAAPRAEPDACRHAL